MALVCNTWGQIQAQLPARVPEPLIWNCAIHMCYN
jgi:hypothetical protein